MHGQSEERPWTFYAFAAFFALFVMFLYGPMIVIYILAFQGPHGGMTFPLNGVSLHWFDALVSQPRVGDIAGSFERSQHDLGRIVIVNHVIDVISVDRHRVDLDLIRLDCVDFQREREVLQLLRSEEVDWDIE